MFFLSRDGGWTLTRGGGPPVDVARSDLVVPRPRRHALGGDGVTMVTMVKVDVMVVVMMDDGACRCHT